jgi:single-strand DNA-binding protein
MAGGNINRVIITGNLTRDPETRALPSGSSVTSMRIACNGRRQNRDTQQWEDVPNYFDVTVWGAQGENCQRYLSKGRPVAIDGRLQWREWQDQQGNKRQSVDIVAESVQFLGGRDDAGAGNGNGFSSSAPAAQSDIPTDTGDFERTPVAAGTDDDIPF